MAIQADLHNFGQQVHLEIANERGYPVYRKPRPVFWEWLFFGTDSPLRSVFERAPRKFDLSRQAHSSAAQFGLTIDFDEGKLTGVSRTIEGTSRPGPVTEADLHAFGHLLGYCYALGIQDLHHGNVLRTNDGLRVIDAEVVLSNLLLPTETLLLPFRDHFWERSAAGRLWSHRNSVTYEEVETVLTGFLASLELMESMASEICQAIHQAISAHGAIPIRVILRDTEKYRNHTAETQEKPLLPEERVQLSRNDIPYFFKFQGQEGLYAYTTPSGNFSSVSIPPYFTEQCRRIGISAFDLLNSGRIRKELIPRGSLSLLRELVPPSWVGTFVTGSIQVNVSDSHFYLRMPGAEYQASRFRGGR